MASRKIIDCAPDLQDIWKHAEHEWKRLYPDLPAPFLTCTHRNNEEQDALYAIGRTKPGKKVTNAKAGQSKHNKLPSEAFDIAFIGVNKKLDWSTHLFQKFYEIIKPFEITWGGNFKMKDYPHFEL